MMLNRFFETLAALVLLLLAPAAFGLDVEGVFRPYSELLGRHVVEHELASGGLVSSFDYAPAMEQADSRALIEEQRQLLARVESTDFETREAALAFWINAYNFFMIAHIVDNADDGRPVESVKDFGNLFNPFRVFSRESFNVAGQRLSLDEMEKETLLGESFAKRGWKDARVHFAVNCASLGCPPLRQQIYTKSNVNALLDANTRRALRTPLHLEIEGDTAMLSSLFDWYQSDFEQAAGSVDAFILRHLDDGPAAAYEAASRQRFIDYDWTLNSPSTIGTWLENRP